MTINQFTRCRFPLDGLRNESNVVNAFQNFHQSKPCFHALKKLLKEEEEEWNQNDEQQQRQRQQRFRAIQNEVRDMTLSGVGFNNDSPEKERFNDIQTKLAQLKSTFSNNVLDETKIFGYDIMDATIVKNVPESAKAMWANAYQRYYNEKDKKENENEKKEKREIDREKGPWRITLDGPSLIACLSHLPDRSIREKIYKAQIRYVFIVCNECFFHVLELPFQ